MEEKERHLSFRVEMNAQPVWCMGAHIDNTGSDRPVDVINMALADYFAKYGYDEESLNISVQEVQEPDGIHYFALEHLMTLTVGDKIVKRYHVRLLDENYADPMNWAIIEMLESCINSRPHEKPGFANTLVRCNTTGYSCGYGFSHGGCPPGKTPQDMGRELR